MTHPEEVESRFRRLVAYFRHNLVRMVVDGSILLAWILASWTVFNWFDLPTWSFYVILFTGAVVYSRITPTWERPYKSPD